jgi:hypothetical protein
VKNGKTVIDGYSGDDPIELAEEIEEALRRYARGAPDRLLAVITFFEGELWLLAKALRLYAATTDDSTLMLDRFLAEVKAKDHTPP